MCTTKPVLIMVGSLLMLFGWAFALATAAEGCATMKGALRTIDDVANVACEVFGTEHPQEFKQLVLNVAPPEVTADMEKAALSVHELCAIKSIVQPFVDDQLRLQQRTAAGLHAQMTGGGDAAPTQ